MTMNTNSDKTPADDELLDRLVDGQLSERQRHDLLAGLDDEPGGWRRCALAFLEAQCWKQAFGAITRDISPSVEPAGATPPPRSVWPGRLSTVAAMAASFVLAMVIGLAVQFHRAGNQISQPGIGNIAGNFGPQQSLPANLPGTAAPC